MRGNEFAEMNAFVAVADHGNFTRAATHLDVSTTTVSQTIRAFEDRLGVRLLNRTTRSVSLTEPGEQLLERLRPLLVGIEEAVEIGQRVPRQARRAAAHYRGAAGVAQGAGASAGGISRTVPGDRA